MATRRQSSDKFKATVALEALRGDRAVQETAAKHRLHPTQVRLPVYRGCLDNNFGGCRDQNIYGRA